MQAGEGLQCKLHLLGPCCVCCCQQGPSGAQRAERAVAFRTEPLSPILAFESGISASTAGRVRSLWQATLIAWSLREVKMLTHRRYCCQCAVNCSFAKRGRVTAPSGCLH